MKPLPLSGSEPTFSLQPWVKSENADNCYDYAIGNYKKYRVQKSTPGNRAGISSNGLTFKTPKGIVSRILKDNPKSVYKCKNSSRPCARGYYKIMCFVAPQNNYGNSIGDFHFYKQVGAVKYKVRAEDTISTIAKFFRVTPYIVKRSCKDGILRAGSVIQFPVNLWSHKMGWGGPPLIVDKRGKTIVDPRKANRNYGYKYKTFVSSFCVKKGMAKSGSPNRGGPQ